MHAKKGVASARIRRTMGMLAVLGLVAPISAQVAFSDATQAVGIQFVTRYGPSLKLAPDIPQMYLGMFDVMQRNMGNGAAVGDYDNDGDFDVLMLGQLKHSNVLYRNELQSGSLQFVDVTHPLGLEDLGLARVAQFVDLDNDGWQDLVVLNDTEPCTTHYVRDGIDRISAIYRNNRGTSFTNVAALSGFNPSGYIHGGMGLVDYDEDGLVDIYVTNWGFEKHDGGAGGDYTMLPGHNRMYRNLGNFKFREVTRSIGLGRLESNCFTPIFADFDRDGDSDLYVAIDLEPDCYYRNDGGVFVDDTVATGANHQGNDMGIAAKDFDKDGDVDLYCTNITFPAEVPFQSGNTLLVNQFMETGQVSFVDQAASRGVLDSEWGWGTEWVDVDNDGDDDLYAVNGFDEWVNINFSPIVRAKLLDKPGILFINDGSGSFTRTTSTGAGVIGDARAAIAFDADRDGDQDLLVTHINAAPALILNMTSPSGNWLDVHAEGGGGSNRDAIGAIIEVHVGGTVHYHDIIGGGSYLSGRPFEAHFGLGTATNVDLVRILWPDGHRNEILDVPVNQRISVVYR